MDTSEYILPATVNNMLSHNTDFNLIDIRDPIETKNGIIKGAKLIPLQNILKNPAYFRREENYIIYCKTDYRSLIAKEVLQSIGINKVKIIKGGILNWAENIDPNISSEGLLWFHINKILKNTINDDFIEHLKNNYIDDLLKTLEILNTDLFALLSGDPSIDQESSNVINNNLSFQSIIHYRIGHMLWSKKLPDKYLYKDISYKILESGKIMSGIDIHPAAKIGQRFVLDHGVGTVIGESCEIGEDVYILNNVILGARGIANNISGKRHPTIGNRVQLGANSRIFGNITIGDDVFIAPNCVVTNSIKNETNVVIVNQLQVISTKSSRSKKLEVHCISPKFPNGLIISGKNFFGSYVSCINEDHTELLNTIYSVDIKENQIIVIFNDLFIHKKKLIDIKIKKSSESIILLKPYAMKIVMEKRDININGVKNAAN